MKQINIQQIVEDTIFNEVKKRIIQESEKEVMEVFHVTCEGQPLETFKTEEEAQQFVEKNKDKFDGKDLLIDKKTYESHEDMIDKLDEMSDMYEENKTETMENKEPKEGNAFTDALIKAKDEGKDTFTVDGKEYDVKESWKELAEESLFEDSEGQCEECGDKNIQEDDDDENDVHSIWKKYSDLAMDEFLPENFSDEFEYADNIISHIVDSAITNGDVSEDDEESLIDDLKQTYGDSIFDVYKSDMGDEDDEDDEDDKEEKIDESAKMCSECGGMLNEEGVCQECKGPMSISEEKMCSECGGMLNEEGMCSECGSSMMKESSKKKLRLRESELVSLISKMVNEAMKGEPGVPGVPGLTITKKAQDVSKKENNKNIGDVESKMKNYLKIEGSDNPEFPKQVGKGDKMAIHNTEKENEYVDDTRGYALEDLDYDHEPSENFKKRLKAALDGDSKMGNSQDAANVVKTDTGKKLLNKSERKDKKEKKFPMYVKDPQPTQNVSESNVSFNKILTEEVEKMKKLANYNKKTQ